MSTNVSELVIQVTSDATKAADGLDTAADATGRVSRAADDAAESAERHSRSLAVSADQTDALATKSSVATGALGALSSGFELVGLDKYAVGLQSAALATDFMSGVGDSLTLVLEATGVKAGIARVKTIAMAGAQRVAGAAARVMAAGQWALNAAMNANPIGLVVLAVVALVALFVVAYKRSATFRAGVQAAGRIASAAIHAVIDVVSDLVHWFADRTPAALAVLRRVAVAAIGAATWPMRTFVSVVSSAVVWVRDRIPAALNTAKGAAQRVGSAIAAPFKAVGDAVQHIIDLVGKIHIPKLPHIPGIGRLIPGGGSGFLADTSPGFAVSGGAATIVNVNVSGAIDPVGTAATIRRVVSSEVRRLGRG